MRFFWGSFLALFLVGVVVALPGAALPRWRAAYGAGEEVGLYFPLLLLGLLLGIRLAQGGGRHPFFPLALGLAGLALWGLALAPGFAWVLALAFPLGLALGVINLHGNSLVGEVFPQSRVKVLNRVNVGFGLGAVATPWALTLLPYPLVLGLAGGVALLAGALVLGAPGVAQKEGVDPRARGLGPFLLLVGLYTGLEGSLATWNRVWLAHQGQAEALGGYLLSLFWLGLALGRFGLASWVGQNPLGGLRALGFGLLGLLLLNLFPWGFWAFPLMGICLGPFFATSVALVQARFGHRALGYLFYAGALGGNLTPGLFSLLPPQGLPWGFLGLAGLLLLLVHSLKRRERYA